VRKVGASLEIHSEFIYNAIAVRIYHLHERVKNMVSIETVKREITAAGNVTVHGYQTLRTDDIWETIHKDIPEVYLSMKKIVDDLSA
jgi:uncharacterized protein with HEPN domain